MDRYEEIRKKLQFKKPEDININLDELPKKMISIYENSSDMFLEKIDNKIKNFNDLVNSYEAYQRMEIVMKALGIIEAYEPLIFNLQEEILYLYELLKENIGGSIAKKIMKGEVKEQPKDMKEDTLISLSAKGYSTRKIAEVLGVSHQTVAEKVRKHKEKIEDEQEKIQDL